MKRSLGSQEDVIAGREASESVSRNFLSIPDKKTPWYLLSIEYTMGFSHWVELPNGRKQRVICAGDPEIKGDFFPDDCPICEYMLGRYQDGKRLRSAGKEKLADKIKDAANNMRAKYEAHFIAVRGVRVLQKTTQGKKIWTADFDMSDEESEVEVGVLSLSHAQYIGLTDMIEDEDKPYIKSGDDLCNRVVWTEKIKQGKRRYKEVKWSASKTKSDVPEVELPEDLSVDEDFEFDEELLNKVYGFITGESSEDFADDEEVEVEEDSEEEPDDDYLDDVEEDEEEEEKESDDESEEEDDFEDDLPYEEDEEEEEPAPTRTRASTGKRKTSSSKTSKGKSAPKARSTVGGRKATSSTERKQSSEKSADKRSGKKATGRGSSKSKGKTSGSARVKSGRTRL